VCILVVACTPAAPGLRQVFPGRRRVHSRALRISLSPRAWEGLETPPVLGLGSWSSPTYPHVTRQRGLAIIRATDRELFRHPTHHERTCLALPECEAPGPDILAAHR
jgi:hypothetical protein